MPVPAFLTTICLVGYTKPPPSKPKLQLAEYYVLRQYCLLGRLSDDMKFDMTQGLQLGTFPLQCLFAPLPVKATMQQNVLYHPIAKTRNPWFGL